jgi:hypothetical protein
MRMWPDAGKGAFFDCKKNGTHRYTIGHFFPKNSDFYLQVCRRCGEKRITRFVLLDGCMIGKIQESYQGPKDPDNYKK